MTTRTKASASVDAHLAARHKRLRAVLKDRELDACYISNANDVRYLIGQPGEDCFVVMTAKSFHVFSDFRYEEELEPLKSWATVVIRRRTLAEEVATIVGDLKVARIAVQAEHMKVDERRTLAKAVGAKVLHDTVGLLSALREIKDEEEIGLIRKAVKIQQEALQACLADLRPGEQTESQFAALLEYEMRRRGAESESFTSIVAAKANGSRPHYRPSPRVKITRNQPLLIDWGARVDGYCSDLTRTFAIGRFPKKVREIYEIVLEAQLAAIDAIRPGARLVDVDAAARDHIARAGYGDHFGHGLGHGIGLNVHEQPSLSWRADRKAELRPGMITTVEPGIYLPGIGGVRIEDDVLVTETGHTVLSSYPKTIDSAVLA